MAPLVRSPESEVPDLLTRMPRIGCDDEGSGWYYLVRGSNDCGNGTYGHRSDATERTGSACP